MLFAEVCEWCREPLVPARTKPIIILLSFGLLRMYQCPHCGDNYLGFVKWRKDDD